MKQSLRLPDLLGLGFMNFAFFFGAGNLIFPPLAGHQAGADYNMAMWGFLLTAVGLPLLSLMAAARAGGGLPKIGRFLPLPVVTALAVAIYLIIGPLFATPRTALVAYEMGTKGLFDSVGVTGTTAQALSSVIFFALAAYFALNRGKLLDNIGKILTPGLVLLLAALAFAVFSNPLGVPGEVQANYTKNAFATGFLDGYNTMDSFGGLMFGMLNIALMRNKGITSSAGIMRNLSLVALIAATGLALVYGSLFHLGAVAGPAAAGVDNGGTIIINYVLEVFGPMGRAALGVMVVLACFTTAVGLMSACGDYFAERFKVMNYKGWVLVFCGISALVANVGLAQLISLTVPVLLLLYPIAIVLIVLNLIGHWLPAPKPAFRLVSLVAIVFGLIDMLSYLGLDAIKPLVELLNKYMPLADMSLGWVVPTVAAMLVAFFGMKPIAGQEPFLPAEDEDQTAA